MRRSVFENRTEAGKKLGKALLELNITNNPVVLALPRGGLPIGLEVARALKAPLDVLLVRKIGAPQQRELAIAAVVEGKPQPHIVIDQETFRMTGASSTYVEQQAKEELREIARRRALYLQNRPSIPVAGRDVVLVDDGIATGTTVRAALKALQSQNPARLILAVPVAPKDTVQELRSQVDQLVCLSQPHPFGAIGYFYNDFHQLGDEEVLQALHDADAIVQHPAPAPLPASSASPTESVPEEEIMLDLKTVKLAGLLRSPPNPRGVIIFAHGSGSSRLSSRNRQVAEHLARAGFATLLFDLLTTDEDWTQSNRFDIALLSDRLVAATQWLRNNRFDPGVVPYGYFGASTGAAAALWASTLTSADGIPIRAVVSRGGRPDLVGSAGLPRVTAPTLLIVGERDRDVIGLNKIAAESLRQCHHELAIVPHATHLFEEPGALEQVAQLAAKWFRSYLVI